jgi:hypothetical protein
VNDVEFAGAVDTGTYVPSTVVERTISNPVSLLIVSAQDIFILVKSSAVAATDEGVPGLGPRTASALA